MIREYVLLYHQCVSTCYINVKHELRGYAWIHVILLNVEGQHQYKAKRYARIHDQR